MIRKIIAPVFLFGCNALIFSGGVFLLLLINASFSITQSDGGTISPTFLNSISLVVFWLIFVCLQFPFSIFAHKIYDDTASSVKDHFVESSLFYIFALYLVWEIIIPGYSGYDIGNRISYTFLAFSISAIILNALVVKMHSTKHLREIQIK